MKVAAAAAVAAFVLPASAHAGDVRVSMRELPLGARSLAAVQAPPTFDLVGLHWQGPGGVSFRTRSLAGHWSAWRGAAPEADDRPDPRTAEASRAQGWHLGNPYWTGASAAIQYRAGRGVRRLRAYFVWSPVERIPLRAVSIAGSPQILPRSAWGANEAIRRAPPEYSPTLQLALVHHTAGSNNYGPADSAAIVRGIEAYHVQGNGWNDIGYNFLVDRYGHVFEGRYGGIDRNVIGAHALGFNRQSVGIAVIGDYGSAPIPAAARWSLVALLAWRLDVAHVDPLSTVSYISSGNERFPATVPVFLRAISGHRDTGYTDCPGNSLYAQLGAIAQAVAATGLPKLFAPSVKGALGGPVHFTAKLSASLPWTVTVTDGGGLIVGSGTGTGAAIDWTWDSSAAPHGQYVYALAVAGARPVTGTVGGAPLTLTAATASPPTISPNGDGVADTTIVKYRLSRPALVTAALVPAAGGTAVPLFSLAKPAGAQSFRFGLAPVSDGHYSIMLSARSADGESAAAAVNVLVDRTLAAFNASTRVISPNGDGVLDSASYSFTIVGKQVRTSLRIMRGTRVAAIVFSGTLLPGPQMLNFGERLPDGHYQALLSVTDDLTTLLQAAPLVIDTTPPRISAVSWRRLVFRVSEPSLVTMVAGPDRFVRRSGGGRVAFQLPLLRGTLRVNAQDAAGNVSAPLVHSR